MPSPKELETSITLLSLLLVRKLPFLSRSLVIASLIPFYISPTVGILPAIPGVLNEIYGLI